MKRELLLAAMGIASLTPGCVKTGIEADPKGSPGSAGNISASKVDVDKLLKRVAEKPAPTDLKMGAMCYDMAMPPERVEYVCPACGGKTIHVMKMPSFDWNVPAVAITDYRNLASQLRKLGLDAQLDETGLCSACRKENQTGLFLCVTVKGKTARNELHNLNDLRKLIAFVQGNLVWKGEQDQEFPLKPELPSIRQLLGVKE